jgi:hypothetical protein
VSAAVNQAQGQRMVDQDDPNYKRYTEESMVEEEDQWKTNIADLKKASNSAYGVPYQSRKEAGVIQGICAAESAHTDGFEGASDSGSDSENGSLSEEESDVDSGQVAPVMNQVSVKSQDSDSLVVTVRPSIW